MQQYKNYNHYPTSVRTLEGWYPFVRASEVHICSIDGVVMHIICITREMSAYNIATPPALPLLLLHGTGIHTAVVAWLLPETAQNAEERERWQTLNKG